MSDWNQAAVNPRHLGAAALVLTVLAVVPYAPTLPLISPRCTPAAVTRSKALLVDWVRWRRCMRLRDSAWLGAVRSRRGESGGEQETADLPLSDHRHVVPSPASTTIAPA